MKYSISFLLLFVFFAFADTDGIKLEQSQSGGGYDVYGVTYSGEKIIIAESVNEPTIKSDYGLVALLFSCGSPCYYTLFFDRNTGHISQEFEAAFFSVDFEHKLVAAPSPDTVTIHAIFEPEKQRSIPIKMTSYQGSYYEVESSFTGTSIIIKHPVEGKVNPVRDTIPFNSNYFGKK